MVRWLIPVVVLVTVAVNVSEVRAQTSTAPGNFLTVEGVAIYLGLIPAEIVRGHPRAHEEGGMHGGAPPSSDQIHVVVALFDEASGKRIEDAQVTAAVTQRRSPLHWKTLEPMRIAGTITYGNYFDVSPGSAYRLQLQIRRPGQDRVIEASFKGRQEPR